METSIRRLLVHVPYPIFIDWADLDKRGICAPLNAIFYGMADIVLFLIRALSGFEILEPGGGKVRLQPKETTFDYEVTIPTAHGVITVIRRNRRTETTIPAGIQVKRE
jgi:hypothetical protein